MKKRVSFLIGLCVIAALKVGMALAEQSGRAHGPAASGRSKMH